MAETDLNWFEKLVAHFIPSAAGPVPEGEIPEAMIASASHQAFAISTAAALPPGPLGLMTIIPELMAVTKVQMNLIYRIAAYYGKQGQVNATLILLIFANEAGLAIGRHIVTRVGTRILIRTLGEESARTAARSVAARIGTRLAKKALGRWVPVVIAPVFGLFSKRLTARIGREAIKLFSLDIEYLEALPDPSTPQPGRADKDDRKTEQQS